MARLRKFKVPTLNLAKEAKFRMGHPVGLYLGLGCPTLRGFRRVGLYGIAITGILGILSGCRQDMHDQPRMKTYAMSDFYADLRSERPPVEGTVARGQLHEDAYFYTGKTGDNPGDYMPSQVPVTAENLARGRERFNIYCAPCHSRLGDGNGMVPQRGYKHPPTYHQDRLRKAPLGYFFDVMTNGFGAMPDYAAQIPPDDRWRIVAYIRALQLSQNATQADASGQAVPSKSPEFEEPGSGATLPIPVPQSSQTGEEQK
jgi:mono/diheme cytochrome c family protein